MDFDLEVSLMDETQTKDFIVRNLILTNTASHKSR